jgi:hypothetical protein
MLAGITVDLSGGLESDMATYAEAATAYDALARWRLRGTGCVRACDEPRSGSHWAVRRKLRVRARSACYLDRIAQVPAVAFVRSAASSFHGAQPGTRVAGMWIAFSLDQLPPRLFFLNCSERYATESARMDLAYACLLVSATKLPNKAFCAGHTTLTPAPTTTSTSRAATGARSRSLESEHISVRGIEPVKAVEVPQLFRYFSTVHSFVRS